MNGRNQEHIYRRAAVQEASSAGLVVILYDLLAADLRQAIVAVRSGDIEERSRLLKHGLLVLQLLEGSLDMVNGGDAARNLSLFYACIRRQVLQAQFCQDQRILEQQISLLLDVRAAWQAVDTPAVPRAAPGTPSPVRNAPGLEAAFRDAADWLA